MLKNSAHLAGELKMNFLDNIENVADIVFAQLNYEEYKGLKLLCSIDELEGDLFPNFVRWFKFFHHQYPSTFNVQKNRLIAFMFAALYRYNPSLLQEYHINMLDKFLSRPRDTSAELGITYPETKGKWNSSKGLYNQIKGIHKIIDTIMG